VRVCVRVCMRVYVCVCLRVCMSALACRYNLVTIHAAYLLGAHMHEAQSLRTCAS